MNAEKKPFGRSFARGAALWMLALTACKSAGGAAGGQASFAEGDRAPDAKTAEAPPESPPAESGPIFTDESLDVLRGRPALCQKVEESFYVYFRLTSIQFANAVCQKLVGELSPDDSLSATLHGDAHLEQFAVTEIGSGLVDFDRAGVGPAEVDLLRFLASLEVAAEMKAEWNVAELQAAFVDAYLAGLRAPISWAPEVPWAIRVRSEFDSDNAEFLAEVDKQMGPLEAGDKAQLLVLLDEFVEKLRTRNARVPLEYLRVKKVGKNKGGVGSFNARKFLIRVEGESTAADDDVILELKSARREQPVTCLQNNPSSMAERVLLSQSAFSVVQEKRLQMPEGAEQAKAAEKHPTAHRFIDAEGKTEGDGTDVDWWIEPWYSEYRELDVPGEPSTFEELVAIARSVGFQLGSSHYAYPDSSAKQRRDKAALRVEAQRDRLLVLSRSLVSRLRQGWELSRPALIDSGDNEE